jgi:aryl-alcohol dehydrogenase-like predicted oxidoreductase
MARCAVFRYSPPMPDRATAEGTAAYKARFADQTASGHFRPIQDLWASSVGLGTYLGEPDRDTDEAYRRAIVAAVGNGCNVIDTAINYRFQQSERAVGAALREVFTAGSLKREEIIVATKGGYLPFDGSPPRDPRRWFHDTFEVSGIATASDLVAGCHCMTPAYLRHQLAASLRNLRLQSVDVYYLHNPETQLQEVPRDEFMRRMREAFRMLEEAAAAGQLRFYGTATWNGYRQPPSAADSLSLNELVDLAAEVGGGNHHFRVIQVPFNLAMLEAVARQNQRVNGDMVSCVEAARRLGITVMSSASILQGRLSQRLPADVRELFPQLRTDAQRAIQFVRSAPGIATALVGMKRVEHVQENLETAGVAPLAEDQFEALFRRE